MAKRKRRKGKVYRTWQAVLDDGYLFACAGVEGQFLCHRIYKSEDWAVQHARRYDHVLVWTASLVSSNTGMMEFVNLEGD